jgi:hypothetical protein
MPDFVIERIGDVTAGRVDALAMAAQVFDQPSLVTLSWNGSHAVHQVWGLWPDGQISLSTEVKVPGGAEPAVATFTASRALSVFRTQAAPELKHVEWRTVPGFVEVFDDALGDGDRNPTIAILGRGLVAPGTRSGSQASSAAGPTAAAPQTRGPVPYVAAGTLSASLSVRRGYAVVASRRTDQKMRLAVWGLDDDSDVKVLLGKVVETLGEPALDLAVVKVREDRDADGLLTGAQVVTASRTTPGNKLRLERWQIHLRQKQDQPPSSITKVGEVIAPEEVTEVEATTVTAPLATTSVVTAVRLASGNLRVIGWRLGDDGTLVRWAEEDAGAVGALGCTHVRGRVVATAVKQGDGTLKLIYWLFPSQIAGTLERKGSATAGAIGSRVRCVHCPGTGTHLGDTVVGVSLPDGKLKLIRWRVQE